MQYFLVSARSLASFKGQIISTGPVVGIIGRIMARHCAMSTLCSDRWDTEFHFDDYLKEELYFWKKNLNNRYCVHMHALVHLCLDITDTEI